ncbi:hypothetical protein J2W42_003042 [Rhizobium tibeticum]|nr:hypothetical protein [Rhizobium tibeticum]
MMHQQNAVDSHAPTTGAAISRSRLQWLCKVKIFDRTFQVPCCALNMPLQVRIDIPRGCIEAPGPLPLAQLATS